MKRVHVFQSVKGGVGCTTSAVGFACWLANEKQETVTLIALNDDAMSVLTNKSHVRVIVAEGAQRVNFNIVEMVNQTQGYVVVDAGTALDSFPDDYEDWVRHLVTQNHYLALRRSTLFNSYTEYDDVVVVMDKEGALSVGDCKMVLKLPMFFSVQRDPALARSIDAGLFPRDLGQVALFQPEQVSA
jgi:cellulose biosynthesis protein BcsQ